MLFNFFKFAHQSSTYNAMSFQTDTAGYRKKSSPSFVYSVVSITLVLFLLGILGTLLFFSNKISKYFKENIEITLILKDDLSKSDVYAFQKILDRKSYAKTTRFFSKEDAAAIMKHQYGEDLSVLGYNPLFASINMYLKADYANADSLKIIESEIMATGKVQEIYYMRALINIVNQNLKKIGLFLIGFALLIFLISITLIDNTIKLMMYSQRFLIRSMQLVGATRWFIIRPYLLKSLANGFISGTMAILFLLGLLYYLQLKISGLIVTEDLLAFVIIFSSVLLFGLLISVCSAYFAINKYLKIKLDDLY